MRAVPCAERDGSHVLFMGIPTNLGAVMAVDLDGTGRSRYCPSVTSASRIS